MKGVYILLLKIGRDTKEKIGALGEIAFDKGIYAYVGSAQNNLEKRVARHMSRSKKVRWHIDYLLDSEDTRAFKAFYRQAGKAEECRIARQIGKTEIPIPGFGCSDCRCVSHLFKIRDTNTDIFRRMTELEAGR